MGGQGAGGKRVLIVDDEASLRFLLRVLFESAGYQVDDAANGQLALERVAEAPPDLISTDFMMPVMNGAELIDELRARPGTDAIPILMISSSAGARERARPDVFLTKPFEPNVVLGHAATLLEGAATR